MPLYTTSVLIDAPRDNVWHVLSDVTKWPLWTPTVTSVSTLDGSELHVGRRFTVTQPKLRPATWTVTSVNPSAGFVWESRVPGMVMIAEHMIEPVVGGQTRVDLSFEFRGLFGAVLGRLSKSLVQSYLDTEADSLRKKVEDRSA